MKKYFIIFTAVFLFSCISNRNNLQKIKYSDDIDYFLKPLKGKNIKYLHLKPDDKIYEMKGGTTLDRGTAIGKIEDFPDKYSIKNDLIIKEAINFYDKQDYGSAYKILNAIENEEKDNLFFLFYYARCLYWMQNEILHGSSLALFKKMEETIDKNANGDSNTVVIDLWFTDIYWKLSGLYIENKDYDKSVYEIAKFLYTNLPYIKQKRGIYEQVLTFLTEAYYFNNDLEMNNYFYKKTLKEFPGNGYVLNFKL